jgi:hypothetical protein
MKDPVMSNSREQMLHPYPKIQLFYVSRGQVIFDWDAPYKMVRGCDLRKQGAWIVNIEFIRIELAPPIPISRKMAIVREHFSSQALGEDLAVPPEWDYLTACHVKHQVPSAVCAIAIVDVNIVCPLRGTRKTMLYDIRFVLDQANAVNAERSGLRL